MIAIYEPTKALLEKLLTSRPKEGDELYIKLRQRAADVLERYAANPLDMSLITEMDELVLAMEALNTTSMSHANYFRSRANIVYISAQSRRTHYAAYVAGRWSADRSIANHFKTWMHCSAADGALELYETIVALDETAPSDSSERSLLRVFAEGALHDTDRFLDASERNVPGNCLTAFNRSRVDMLSGQDSRIRMGIRRLKEIRRFEDPFHPAEISWHIDNHKCFSAHSQMTKSLRTNYPSEFQDLSYHLKSLHDDAQRVRSERGETIWLDQPDYQKILVTAAAASIVALVTASVSGADMQWLHDILHLFDEVTTSVQPDGSTAFTGGGGLRSINFLATMSSALGGGGL